MIYRQILLFLFILPQFAFNSTLKSIPDFSNKYIIQLDSEKSKGFESNLATSLGISQEEINIEAIFPTLSIYSITFSTSITTLKVREAISKNDNIKSIQKDVQTTLRSTIPNDIDFSEQWNLNLIGAPDAWDKTKGGKTKNGHEIVVAIIDNGYDTEHEDLIDNIWTNDAEIPSNGIDDDDNGYIDDYRGVNTKEENGTIPTRTHGTGVAGIIGARGNNKLGISGINWDIKLMLITGQAFVSDIIESYNYALTQRKLFNDTEGREGALVVATNFSSGIDEAFAEDYPVWCSIYDALGEEGILNVAAAPNKNVDIDLVGDMPATCPSEFLVIVNNIDRNENLASDSGFGEIHIDIAAPGDEAFSLSIRNTYNEFSGTSSSTPHVAGAIALMYSVEKSNLGRQLLSDPKGTATSIKNTLYSSAARSIALSGTNSSGGRLDLSKAIEGTETLYEEDNVHQFKIIPNLVETNSVLAIQYLANELEDHAIDVFDMMGRWIDHREFTPSNLDLIEIKIPINQAYQSGQYIIQISNTKGKSSEKFTVY